MKVIGIETSGTTGSVGALGDGIEEERPFPGGTSHGRDLAPALEALLHDLGWSLQEVELIAVSAGPGSYTGLRIGLAFAKALAFARAVPLIGVPTFEAMVRRGPEGEARRAPVLDARWGQIYVAAFERENGRFLRRTPDRVGALPDVLEGIPEGTCFFGPGAAVYGEALATRGTVASTGPWDRTHAVEVAAVGKALFRDRGADDPDRLHPRYLRPSQAEAKTDETEVLG
jgi:tRNA threonylcarbamoyladenosine biosynthesis protein TsaB